MADCIGCDLPLSRMPHGDVPDWHDRCARLSGIVPDSIYGIEKFPEPSPRRNRSTQFVPPTPTSLSRLEVGRPALIDELGDLCYFCHEKLTAFTITREHLQPKSRGGANSTPNIVAACRRCNHAKSDMTESEFYAWLERVARIAGLIR